VAKFTCLYYRSAYEPLMAHRVSETGFLEVWCVSYGLDMYGYSGLGDRECVSSEFTVRGSPVC